MASRVRNRFWLAAALLAAAGCGQLLGVMPDYTVDGGDAGDAGASPDDRIAADVSVSDTTVSVGEAAGPGEDGATADSTLANADADSPDEQGEGDVIGDRANDSPDEGRDAEAGPDAEWEDFTNAVNWQAMSVGTASGVAGAGSYAGGAFDGRYVYFAPYAYPSVLIYDSTLPFTQAISWTPVDLSQVDSRALSFSGAAYDGRYVYLVPQTTAGRVVMQCDTRAAGGCLSIASWSAFSLSPLDDGGTEYQGAVYDGRYLTLVPWSSPAGPANTRMAQFDTRADGGFSASSSWSTFSIATVITSVTVGSFFGGLFDGHHLYFVPGYEVAVYDEAFPLSDPRGWSEVAGPNLPGDGFLPGSGAFDGRFVYLGPVFPASSVARCDTQGDSGGCGTASAWTGFSMTAIDAGGDAGVGGFLGSAFDGRYVYFAPILASNPPSTISVRFDTMGTFTDPASWSSFDLAGLGANASGFEGAVFDGEYVYFVPQGSHYIVRFHARHPSAPTGFPTYGSFY